MNEKRSQASANEMTRRKFAGITIGGSVAIITGGSISMQAATETTTNPSTFKIGGELTVNRLGFGAMRITGPGIWGPPKDHAGALAVLRRAVELDVNFIDTADSYGPNVSEELIAEALSPYPPGLAIATKGGWLRPAAGYWSHDASPAHLRDAVEG